MKITLENKDLLLRPLELADAAVLSGLANNPKIWRNVRDYFPHPYLLADAEYFIDKCQKSSPQDTFAIIYQGSFVGVMGFIFKTDIYRYTAEVGYWIGEPYWGEGIATKALKLLIKHGFEALKLKRLIAFVMAYNIPSMKVLEKNGFVQEGILRKNSFKNDQFWDEHVFGLLNDD